MNKHTAAPWESTASTPEDGFECFFIHAGEGYSQRQIATVNGPQDEKGEANARLIAAAPELLEALKDVLDRVSIDDWNEKVYYQAQVAIAKATGEQA